MGIVQWARNGAVHDVLPNSDDWGQLAQIAQLSLDASAPQGADADGRGQPAIAQASNTFGESNFQDQDALDSGAIAREYAKLVRQCDAARRSDVFTLPYLVDMPNAQVRGAGNQDLANAMTVLQGQRDPQSGAWSLHASDQQVEDALKTIAVVRNVPLDEVKIDFAKFGELVKKREAAANRAGVRTGSFDENDPTEARVPMLALGAPGDIADNHAHMGSIAQLRFGKMIGDTLGVDPVFGALLSPTGGIAGPGNREISALQYLLGGGRDVVIAHGIAHDAGGYLYNYHNLGPGYQYVPNMPFHILDRGDPVGGQKDGLNFMYNVINYHNAQAPRINGEV